MKTIEKNNPKIDPKSKKQYRIVVNHPGIGQNCDKSTWIFVPVLGPTRCINYFHPPTTNHHPPPPNHTKILSLKVVPGGEF